jgi:Xaa-Pro aminopeptidase
MEDKFDVEFFRGNRERLRQLFVGTAPIVVTANGLLQMAADEAYPFHQDRNFWYLTGIDEPGIILVMDKDREYLIVPPREKVREQFDGAISPENLSEISGVGDVYYEKDGWKKLSTCIKKSPTVATLAANPKFMAQYGIFSNPARMELIDRLKESSPNFKIVDLRRHLSQMRMVKQPVEIAAIQRAIDITADAIQEVTRPSRLAKYTHEYEVEADLTRAFRRAGSRGHAFSPIVSGGDRACTLHQSRNEMPLASDELLLMDIGAEYHNYAADLSRTVSLSGRPSKRQQQVYNAVVAAQDFAFSLLKPGVKIRDYENQVEHFIGEKLRELGLIKSINSEQVRRYYPHASSHFLGLDVHDAGDYDAPLAPGVLITVEPGIYIPDEGIGVRIEDNVLITETGYKNLSAKLPRKLV